MRNPGDEVDASEWKNVKALEDQRYIEPLDTDTPAVSRPGPSPDPRLIQEAQARAGRSKNSESGGIASMEEIEDEAASETVETSDGESKKSLRGKLPEDFPGRVALEAAGITTYGQLRELDDLTALDGIGDATAAKIHKALEDE
jgi:predicted flap endonuclease-1-like 5' DNA nuclease